MAEPIWPSVGKPVVLVLPTSLPIIFWYSICSAVMPAVLADGAVPDDWVAKNQIPRMDKKMSSETRPAFRLRDFMK